MLTATASQTFDDGRKPFFHHAPMDTIGQRIKAARASAKVTQQWLADRVGVSRAAVAQWEAKENPTVPEHQRLLLIAEALGIPPGYLLAGDEAPSEPQPIHTIPGIGVFDPRPVPSPASLRSGLPVYGVGACHNSYGHQAFEMQGDVIDRVKYPPALVNVPGAYAIYCRGDSMEPRYFEGELVYVHPGRPPQPGSFVVVQIRPDHDGGNVLAMIKRLVRRSPSKITLAQYNPAQEFDIPADRVHSVHRILNGDELF